MHSMSGRLCQPPCKSRTADRIPFEKESDFCTAFVLAVGRLTSQIVLDITTSKLNIYI